MTKIIAILKTSIEQNNTTSYKPLQIRRAILIQLAIQALLIVLYVTNSFSGPIDSWTSHSAPWMRTITYGAGKFVGVNNNNYIFYSADNAATWVDKTQGNYDDLIDVAYGNNIFVAVGYNIFTSNTVYYKSSDGISWTRTVLGGQDGISSIAYGNGKFISCGLNGAILTSGDGSTWIRQVSKTNENLSLCAYGNGKFAVFGSTVICTSSDGITWTVNSLSIPDHVFDVAFGNGKFVAVGYNGVSSTSVDAVTWSIINLPNITFFRSIAFGAGYFVAIDSSNSINSSIDGIVWKNRSSSSDWLQDITYGNGFFIAVGQNVIIQSGNVAISDTFSPVISSFTIPAVSNSLTISPINVTATDDIDVTGYMITANTATPSANGSNWSILPPTFYTLPSNTPKGVYTLYAWAKDASGKVSLPASAAVNITFPTLGVTIDGTGAGNINSDSGGITCPGNCSATYSTGSVVLLTEAPDSNSIFGGWSGGPCTLISGNCSVTVDTDKTIKATFTKADNARIGTTPYTTLTDAFAHSANGIILARSIEFSETQPLTVLIPTVFKGGYNADFTSNIDSLTTLIGSLDIQSGSLAVQGLTVR
ncbi:MAG: hypothetical protein HXX11_15135 [Desulfuromonadales bacterium]|nr:hypothetical protein [Desulfuromonadales bacterium]